MELLLGSEPCAALADNQFLGGDKIWMLTDPFAANVYLMSRLRCKPLEAT